MPDSVRPILVKKFGGSSLASVAHIEHAAKRVVEDIHRARLVVVVSAMQGETDRLIAMARDLGDPCSAREMEVLLASAEQVSAGLMALALQRLGVPAVSLLGWQVPIVTDQHYGMASIRAIGIEKMQQWHQQGYVVVVAGFQGVDQHGHVTTLARGGSDLTAVALASALQAEECQIYTDVSGVYDVDPHIVADATLLPYLDYEHMQRFAAAGAKILQDRAAAYAEQGAVRLRIRSTFDAEEGTVIGPCSDAHSVSSLLFAQQADWWWGRYPNGVTQAMRQQYDALFQALDGDQSSQALFGVEQGWLCRSEQLQKIRQAWDQAQLPVMTLMPIRNISILHPPRANIRFWTLKILNLINIIPININSDDTKVEVFVDEKVSNKVLRELRAHWLVRHHSARVASDEEMRTNLLQQAGDRGC